MTEYTLGEGRLVLDQVYEDDRLIRFTLRYQIASREFTTTASAADEDIVDLATDYVRLRDALLSVTNHRLELFAEDDHCRLVVKFEEPLNESESRYRLA